MMDVPTTRAGARKAGGSSKLRFRVLPLVELVTLLSLLAAPFILARAH